MLEADHSRLLESCTFVPADADGAGQPAAVRRLLDSLRPGKWRSHVAPDLTPDEARLLGLTVLPEGGPTHSIMLYQQIAGYYQRNGRLPQNAADCFDYLTDPDAAARYGRMSDPTRRFLLVPLVDPLTGKLYADFGFGTQAPYSFDMQITRLAPDAFDAGPGTVAQDAPLPADCGCDGAAPVPVQATANGPRLQTPAGPVSVRWEAQVVRYGGAPGRVIERCSFIF